MFNIVEIMLPTVSRDKLLHAVVDVVDAFGDRVEKDNTTVRWSWGLRFRGRRWRWVSIARVPGGLSLLARHALRRRC